MSGLTRWERGAYALSALLALSAVVFWPVVRTVDPVLAVAIASSDERIWPFVLSAAEGVVVAPDDLVDPWGQPWRCLAGNRPDRRWVVFSFGPDGHGDSGDEIVGGEHYFQRHPVSASMPRWVRQRPQLTLLAGGAALALWTLLMRGAIRAPRHERNVREAARAAAIVALPASAAAAWVLAGVPFLMVPHLEQRFFGAGAAGSNLVPASIAIPLTWALLCYLPALAWRLSRPRPEAALT